MSKLAADTPDAMPATLASQALPYWIDAWQRSVLFLDTLRQRGTNTLAHEQAGKPPVLDFEYSVVADAREFASPANYALLRIKPAHGALSDDTKRPFVVIDPRAGHGPGIGGSKIDSEVGVALRAGHPCYFVSFFPEPCPGQTIESIARAEAMFLQEVSALHPLAEGKPFVIGNCQGGWALMMLAAAAPDLVGPILLAGSPLAYWSGVEGQYPMRYSGGLLGGSWLTSLAGDLGNGTFDGAHLVANFEQLDPANSFWSKWYQLYANVDTEPERFLDFEKWWGGHYLLNKAEMDWIVQNLFVGNKLTAGQIHSADRETTIDLRSVRSPIVVFASWGDNITPPQQALNWIPDLYADVDEIRAHEQVIVYCLHENAGHLGLFVSAKVADREHTGLIGGLDLIDTLPPGLYEAKITDTCPEKPLADLVDDRYLFTMVPRTVQDILALDDGRQDEQAFQVVKRVAEINQGLYDSFGSPFVKMMSSESSARVLRACHPMRLGRFALSDLNPAMINVKWFADWVRTHRQPIPADNAWRMLEGDTSRGIELRLDHYRDSRDAAYEKIFRSIFASPWLAAAVGLSTDEAISGFIEQDLALRDQVKQLKIESFEARFEQASPLDAWVRIMLYQVRDEQVIDERPFNYVRRMMAEQPDVAQPTKAQLKQVLKDQAFLMMLDAERAINALPGLLPSSRQRGEAIAAARKVAGAKGPLSETQQKKFVELENLLSIRATTGKRGRAPLRGSQSPSKEQ